MMDEHIQFAPIATLERLTTWYGIAGRTLFHCTAAGVGALAIGTVTCQSPSARLVQALGSPVL